MSYIVPSGLFSLSLACSPQVSTLRAALPPSSRSERALMSSVAIYPESRECETLKRAVVLGWRSRSSLQAAHQGVSLGCDSWSEERESVSTGLPALGSPRTANPSRWFVSPFPLRRPKARVPSTEPRVPTRAASAGRQPHTVLLPSSRPAGAFHQTNSEGSQKAPRLPFQLQIL